MEELTPTQVSGRLRASLATIRDLYDEMLMPRSRSGEGSPSILDATERIIAIREEIGYQTWATIDALSDELNLQRPTCSEYDVLTHCAWLREHAEDFPNYTGAHDALQEIEDCAEAITNTVFGHHRPRLALGTCTITNCGGTVRDAGPDEDGHHLARCNNCGTTAGVKWWAEQMNMPIRDTLTAAELIVLAHQQYGRRLKPGAIRVAVHRGQLHPLPNEKPQSFKMSDCIDYLTRTA